MNKFLSRRYFSRDFRVIGIFLSNPIFFYPSINASFPLYKSIQILVSGSAQFRRQFDFSFVKRKGSDTLEIMLFLSFIHYSWYIDVNNIQSFVRKNTADLEISLKKSEFEKNFFYHYTSLLKQFTFVLKSFFIRS